MVLDPTTRSAQLILELDLDPRPFGVEITLHSAQSGAHEDLEGDQRRYGVAREPKRQLGADLGEGERHAGAKIDAPEMDLPQLGERGLDVVAVANRHAARRDEHVGAIHAFADEAGLQLAVIAGFAEGERDCAGFTNGGEQRVPVAIADAAEWQRLT